MSKEKKILVLIMSCNSPSYKAKEELIRNTWFNYVKNHKNVSGCYFFTASSLYRYKLDKENNIIYVPVNDCRDRTFQKFIKTVFFVEKLNIEFDYILRLNISTYPNINLIDKFIQTTTDEKAFYCGTLCNNPWFSPKGLLMTQGEYILLSKYNLEILKDYYLSHKSTFDKMEEDTSDSNLYYNDDGFMTYILYNYYMQNYNDYNEFFKNIHALGIVHEPGSTLEHTNKNYLEYLAVNYKTEFKNNFGISLDHVTSFDKVNEAKILGIDEIYKNGKYEDKYLETVLKNINTQCYDIVQTTNNSRFFDDECITKDECILNFKKYNIFNNNI